MADTKNTESAEKPKRARVRIEDSEATAFALICNALAALDAEAVHRTLDHVAKRYGFYVSTELSTTLGRGEPIRYGDDNPLPPVGSQTWEPTP